MAGGRPTKYKSEYCKKVIAHMSMGYSLRSFAADINVSHECIYEWARRYRKFSDAISIGREKQAKFYEQIGLGLMTGNKNLIDGNVSAFIWMTKNMLGWRDKLEQTVESTSSVRVASVAEEALEASFKRNQEKV